MVTEWQTAAGLVDAYRGAVWFVPLAGIADPSLVPDAIRQVLALPPSPGRDALEQVAEALSAGTNPLALFRCMITTGLCSARVT